MSGERVSRRFFLSASVAAGGGLLLGYSLSSSSVIGDVVFASPSEKAGHDIGFERALTDWIVKHRSKWRKSRQTTTQQNSTSPQPVTH